MKTIIIDSERQKTFAMNLIQEMPVDGTFTVEIKKTDVSSTARQRRLQWRWNTEVSQSGLGRDDTKEGVHTTAKWLFARPILLRDSEVFGAIFEGFSHMIQDISDQDRGEYWRQFTSYYISTEQMSRRQRAEYLREFEMYWRGRGVDLTNPDLQGLDENLGWTPKKEEV
jgi:hypothetical protein